MVKHNNVRPNIHMHKDYQRWIKCHFNQPGQKKRRAKLRRRKASRKAPRPMQKLRPIVQCETIKYNMRSRLGRGFTPKELTAVGIKSPAYARTIGIAVDRRRCNKSQGLMGRNVRRLKEYLGNLVLFPLKPTRKEMKDEEKMIAFLMAEQKAKLKMAGKVNFIKAPMPHKYDKIAAVAKLVKLDEVPDYDAYGTMKNEWCEMKNHFAWRRRDLRANYKKKAEEKKAAKKKAKGK